MWNHKDVGSNPAFDNHRLCDHRQDSFLWVSWVFFIGKMIVTKRAVSLTQCCCKVQMRERCGPCFANPSDPVTLVLGGQLTGPSPTPLPTSIDFIQMESQPYFIQKVGGSFPLVGVLLKHCMGERRAHTYLVPIVLSALKFLLSTNRVFFSGLKWIIPGKWHLQCSCTGTTCKLVGLQNSGFCSPEFHLWLNSQTKPHWEKEKEQVSTCLLIQVTITRLKEWDPFCLQTLSICPQNVLENDYLK